MVTHSDSIRSPDHHSQLRGRNITAALEIRLCNGNDWVTGVTAFLNTRTERVSANRTRTRRVIDSHFVYGVYLVVIRLMQVSSILKSIVLRLSCSMFSHLSSQSCDLFGFLPRLGNLHTDDKQ